MVTQPNLPYGDPVYFSLPAGTYAIELNKPGTNTAIGFSSAFKVTIGNIEIVAGVTTATGGNQQFLEIPY